MADVISQDLVALQGFKSSTKRQRIIVFSFYFQNIADWIKPYNRLVPAGLGFRPRGWVNPGLLDHDNVIEYKIHWAPITGVFPQKVVVQLVASLLDIWIRTTVSLPTYTKTEITSFWRNRRHRPYRTSDEHSVKWPHSRYSLTCNFQGMSTKWWTKMNMNIKVLVFWIYFNNISYKMQVYIKAWYTQS